MPKANKVGKTRKAARSPQSFGDNDNDETGQSQSAYDGLSKGQRKKLMKKRQWEKKMMVVQQSLTLKNFRAGKGGGGGGGIMSGLDDALKGVEAEIRSEDGVAKDAASAAAAAAAAAAVKTNKAKHTLGVAEVGHLKLVLQHPSFVEDPFAAIKEHLNNTLPECEDNSGVGEKRAKKGKGKGKDGVGQGSGVVKKKRNGSRRRR